MRTIHKNLNDEAKKKLLKSDQKRKQIICGNVIKKKLTTHKNLNNEAKQKRCKADMKRIKTICEYLKDEARQK